MTRFGDVTISELRFSRATVERLCPAPDDRNALQLLFVLDGDVFLGPGGLQRQLGALDWSVCSGALRISASDHAHAVILTIPGWPHAPRDAVHAAASGVGNVLLTCIRSALRVADDLTAQARGELGNSLQDLARLAIRERTAPAHRLSGRGVMRERVKAFVRRHLRDSPLSIDDIAHNFNCTKRYLHKVFSEDERSLNEYIWDMRLERCSHDLANADLLQRSITEIAFVWGFRSSPHFSRVFRQRFGASPSVYRSRHLRGGTARITALRAPAPRAAQAL